MDSNKKLKITLLIAAIGGALIGKWAMSVFFSQEEKTANALMQVASNINARLPMNIDSETLLFSTTGGQNNFSYNYELVNVFKSGFDAAVFESTMRPNIKNTVCTTRDMAAFRDMGITVTYRYFDADRVQVSQIDVDTTRC